MAYQDLSRLGYRPKGASSGAMLEGILSGIDTFLPAYKEAKEKRSKKEKEKVDMYISLRKAGYSKDEAYDAIYKDTALGKPSGTDKFEREEEKEKLEIKGKKLDIEKKEAEKEKGWKDEKTLTAEQKENRRLQRNQIFEVISTKTGYDESVGRTIKFRTPEEMKAYLTESFKYYDPTDPDITAAIKEAFAKETKPKKPKEKEKTFFGRLFDNVMSKDEYELHKRSSQDIQRRKKARAILQEKRFKGTDAQIDQFLKNNPNF